MFNRIINYWKTLKQYWSTPKGHHDIIDYSRAIIIILTISLIISIILIYFFY